MATKAQAIAALKKHEPKATLIDEAFETGYSVQIEAPEGHHWECDVHCRPVPTWHKSGNKDEYWNEVIAQIKDLPPAVKCDSDDCEGFANWGECEYWEGA
jgi:hypothetical protein